MSSNKIYDKIRAALKTVAPTKVKSGGLPVRISSAAVLLPVSVGVAVVGSWLGWLLVSIIALAAIREWVRMIEPANERVLVGALLVMSGILAVAAWWHMAAAALLALVAGGVIASQRKDWRDRCWLALGFPYVTLGCLALLWLRAVPDDGPMLVLYLLGVVWATDSAAFFVGRSYRGPLLVPTISPRKTWSGLIGGMIAGGLAGGVIVLIFSIQSPIWGGIQSPIWGGMLGTILALICHGGDLLESALKRRYQVKDSGRMIPGHGGLLDRVDSLFASAPALVVVHEVTSWG